jgi:hypothetical protein
METRFIHVTLRAIGPSSHLTPGRTWVACRRQILGTSLSAAAPRWWQGGDGCETQTLPPSHVYFLPDQTQLSREPGARRGLWICDCQRATQLRQLLVGNLVPASPQAQSR